LKAELKTDAVSWIPWCYGSREQPTRDAARRSCKATPPIKFHHQWKSALTPWNL